MSSGIIFGNLILKKNIIYFVDVSCIINSYKILFLTCGGELSVSSGMGLIGDQKNKKRF